MSLGSSVSPKIWCLTGSAASRSLVALLGQRYQEPWLLVSSAWHMPRSMDEFEAVGRKVTPYPVDFRTGDSTPLTEYALAQSLLRWQTALHEWLGLWVCGVTAWVKKNAALTELQAW